MSGSFAPSVVPPTNVFDERLAALTKMAGEQASEIKVGKDALAAHAQDAANAGDSTLYGLIQNLSAGWTHASNTGAAAILGGIPRMAGNVIPGGKPLADAGQSIEDFFMENIQYGPQPTRRAMSTGEGWLDNITNPEKFSYNLGSLASNVAQMVTPGAALKVLNTFRAGIPALIKAARLGEDAIKLAPELAERGLRLGRAMANAGSTAEELAGVAAEIGVRPDVFANAVKASRPLFDDPAALQKAGNAIGAAVAAHTQGYQTYKTVKEAGGNEAEALAAYGTMALVAGKADAHLLSRWFGEFPPDLKGRILNAGATVGVNSLLPVADLVTQWGATLGGDVPRPEALATIASTMEAVQSGLGPAALLGFVTGSGYSKAEKKGAPGPEADAVGEPAHGAIGFTGRADTNYYFYGSERSVTGKRIHDNADGTFLVRGTNGEPNTVVPYDQVKSVYMKQNSLGGEDGQLLYEDTNPDNPIAAKAEGDALLKKFQFDVETSAKRVTENLTRRTVKAEANRLVAETFHERVKEVNSLPAGEKRTAAIDTMLETLGPAASNVLSEAMQPASNRKTAAKLEVEIKKAAALHAELTARHGLADTPEGPILLSNATARLKMLQAQKDVLDILHNDMLPALGKAGEATSLLGGKKGAKLMGEALSTDPESVEGVRASLQSQVDQFNDALGQTQGLPPDTDLRVQAKQGRDLAQAALDIFDRFAPLSEGEADNADLNAIRRDAQQERLTATQADPASLADLGYTPEEISHLEASGRALDVVQAGLERPVIRGAGVRSTLEQAAAVGLDARAVQKIASTPTGAAELALALLPREETQPVAQPEVDVAAVGREMAVQKHSELSQQASLLRNELDRVEAADLDVNDPGSLVLAEARGQLESAETQMTLLERENPGVKQSPRQVRITGLPGGDIVSSTTIVHHEPAGTDIVTQAIEGKRAANVQAATEVLSTLPDPLQGPLTKAIENVGTGRFLIPEAQLFRKFLKQMQDPVQVKAALTRVAEVFQTHTDMHGNEYKAATMEDIAKALGVEAKGRLRFGLEDNAGQYRLFQKGSPKDIEAEAIERFHEVATVGVLRKNPGLVRDMLQGKLSPLEVAATLLESEGAVVLGEGKPDANGVPTFTMQVVGQKPVERMATLHAFAALSNAIEQGLAAGLKKTYSPTILTTADLPLMRSGEWDNRFNAAMEPGAWLSDFRNSLRQARKESGAVIRPEEEALFLRMFHGMMEHAATAQGIHAEDAARKWLESRPGSGNRPYAKDAFFGIVGSPSGDPAEALGPGRRSNLRQDATDPVLQKLIDTHGVTENPKATSFILPDGRWINSLGHSGTSEKAGTTTDALLSKGAMRVNYDMRIVELGANPTSGQISALKRYWSTLDSRESITVDYAYPAGGGHIGVDTINATPKNIEAVVKGLMEKGPLMQSQGDIVKGWFDTFERGPHGMRGLITLTQHADFATLVEEMAHFTRTTLSSTDYAKVKASVNGFLKEKGLPEIRSNGTQDVWSRDAEEVFAKWTLAGMRDVPIADVPASLRPTMEKVKPILSSLWDSTLDVYGSPPRETRAAMIRLFNPLLPKVNATGKMVGVRIKEQASKYGVNTFTATLYNAEAVAMAASLAAGTDSTKAVYEANHTNTDTVLAEVSEWLQNPTEAEKRINEIMTLGGAPGASLQVYSLVRKMSGALPAWDAMLNAKTDKQRKAASDAFEQELSLVRDKEASMAVGQALWGRSLDPTSKMLSQSNGVLQLTKQMSKSDAAKLFQDIQLTSTGDEAALKRVMQTAVASSVEAPHLMDYLKQMAYGGIMLGPRTHATNAVMIGVMAGMMKLPIKATAALVDAGVSYATGRSREIFFREMSMNRTAIAAGIRRGKRGVVDIMTKGMSEDPLDNARKLTDADRYSVHQLAFEHAPDSVKVPFLGERAWGSKLRKIAPVISVGTNFAHATDFAARAVIYHDNLWQLSLRKVLQDGAADPHLAANALMKRAMDGTQDTETLRRDARLQALQATGADEPGTFTKHLIQAKNSFGIAALPFMPFVNTLANLMKRSAELVPGVGYGVWKSQVHEQLGNDTPTFYVDKPQEMVAKQIVGGFLALTVASMFMQKDEDGLPLVTGSKPVDTGERGFWQRNGILPYSMKVGGYYVQFNRIDPLGMTLMAAAGAADAWKHYDKAQSDPRHPENADAYKVTENFFNTMFNDVRDNSYASNFFRIADRDGSTTQEALRSLTALVPFSGVFRQFASATWQAHNNGEYVAPDVAPALGAVMGIVPWAWSGLDVQPKLDAFGKPIVYRAQSGFQAWWPVQVSDTNELDPVEKELRRLSVYPTVPLPEKKMVLTPNGQKFDIPPDLYAQMVTEFGIRGKETLAKIITSPGYESQRDTTMAGVLRQAQILDKALGRVRSSYEHWLKGQMHKRLQAGLLERPVPLQERPDITAE